jgi:hypothetical protein
MQSISHLSFLHTFCKAFYAWHSNSCISTPIGNWTHVYMNLPTRNSPYYHLLKYLLFLLKHSVYHWFIYNKYTKCGYEVTGIIFSRYVLYRTWFWRNFVFTCFEEHGLWFQHCWHSFILVKTFEEVGGARRILVCRRQVALPSSKIKVLLEGTKFNL